MYEGPKLAPTEGVTSCPYLGAPAPMPKLSVLLRPAIGAVMSL